SSSIREKIRSGLFLKYASLFSKSSMSLAVRMKSNPKIHLSPRSSQMAKVVTKCLPSNTTTHVVVPVGYMKVLPSPSFAGGPSYGLMCAMGRIVLSKAVEIKLSKHAVSAHAVNVVPRMVIFIRRSWYCHEEDTFMTGVVSLIGLVQSLFRCPNSAQL